MSKSSVSPGDTVVVHAMERGKTIPHISPFVLKLETYLRIANIPYQFDSNKPMGSNGKMPWISLNGKELADSQLIIEYLNTHFNKSLWPASVTKSQKAQARLLRISLEEHCYWGLVHWRWIESPQILDKVQEFTAFRFWLVKMIVPRQMRNALHQQGVGRLSKEEIVQTISQDLRDLSELLGDKPYILGNEPCQEDAAIFGLLAQFTWATPGSPYENLINDELLNLKEYCVRMKAKYWEDWDTCLGNQQPK